MAKFFNTLTRQNPMQKQVPDYSKASILVVGDVMLDRYWFGDTARISPEAPVPVVNIKQIDERPGGAGNVALNISALGAKVTLLGISGNDAPAQTLSEQLSAANVHHDILRLNHAPTITKLRVISRHQQLLRLDFEEKLTQYEPKELIEIYKKHLSSANLVILSDYNKGTLACAKQLIALARAANIPVLVDPKGTDFSIYQGANIITPNLKEFETVVGACHSEQDIMQKGQAFLASHDIDALLLTRGEHGMTLIQKNKEELHLPAHAREVFDVTGAGDTVIAVLGATLAAGGTFPEAMALANLAAGLVVAKLGAATVSTPELHVALTGSSVTTTGIVNDEQLLLAMSEARLNGKKVVFTNGCFDILHAGHVTYLQQAKQLGDYLVVAVNDDASIKKLKGAGRPINNTEQRLAVLASLGVVDWVIPFSDDTPERLLKKLKPDILVKGGDYTIDQVVGHEIVRAYGGDVRVLGVVKDISTTLIIDRMVRSVRTEND
jgi:D-beta-D-heptose 7-phosphate kinase/D-beta-D-heptose 1-phosphate adenosyltransferase